MHLGLKNRQQKVLPQREIVFCLQKMMHLLNRKDVTGSRHNPSPQRCGNTARGDFIIVSTVKVCDDHKELCLFVCFFSLLAYYLFYLSHLCFSAYTSMHFAPAWPTLATVAILNKIADKLLIFSEESF